jgi:hypothetical protein
VSARPKAGIAAAAVIALVIAGMLMLGWAFMELQRRYGPNYGAVLPDGRLVIASHGHLHVFRSEQRIARIAFTDLGLGPLVSDLDAAADGTLLAADAERKSLLRCRLDTPRCSVFFDGAARPGSTLRKAFKAALEFGTGRVVVSDSSNHRLLLLDAQGRVIRTTPTNGPRFTFPNGLTFLGEGLLAVADTDHVRIAFVRLSDEGFADDETELHMRQVFPGSDLLHPIDVVADSVGRLWAILASNTLETGVVVSMQGDGSKPHHVTLPPPADPLSLVAIDGAMLVLEPSTYRVTRIALAGQAIAPFGDAAFQQELKEEAEQRSRLQSLRKAGQALLVIALIAALVVAVRSGTMRVLPQLRPRWSIPEAPTPLPGGIDWIAVNPLPARAMMFAYLALSFLVLAGYYIWLQSVIKLSAQSWTQLQLLIGTLVLIALWTGVLVRRMSRGRLGTDGSQLLVEDAGRTFAAPLAEVLYSNTRLLVGSQIIVLRLPSGDRYPPKRIAGAMLARLPASAQRGEWQLSRIQLSRAWQALRERWKSRK